ncbi:MAG: GTP-binding protein [Candidatus Heimdallarchaeota archaeon]|nr:GTP-binding protein [Candidatus Heimdallarchaeota archaeon]
MVTKPFKLILIGSAAVGKTTLRKNFMGENTGGNYLATIGADFSVSKVEVDGEEHTLQIWDLAGQSQFGVVRDGYFRGTKGILLVFDLLRRESFDELEGWINEFVDKNEIEPIVILGNKSDLPNPVINKSEVLAYVNSLQNRFEEPTFHVRYFETSAINGTNVEEAFHELTRLMVQNREHFS